MSGNQDKLDTKGRLRVGRNPGQYRCAATDWNPERADKEPARTNLAVMGSNLLVSDLDRRFVAIE